MSKRQADQDEYPQTKAVMGGQSRHQPEEISAMGEFEDAWEDEIEEESGAEEDMEEESMDQDGNEGMEVDEPTEEEQEKELKMYLPGQALEEGEVLEADQSVYIMLHNLDVRLPFLSFDVLNDSLGDERKNFPATAYVAAGTSVPGVRDNEVVVMKLSNLHKTQQLDEDDEEDDPQALDEDPVLEHRAIPHNGCVNRLRVMPQSGKHLASTWSESGKVYIYDLDPYVTSLDVPGTTLPKQYKPLAIHNHGREEGYAMDWSSLDAGKLLTGDNAGLIYHSTITPHGVINTDSVAFREHKSSVEDIQWSPTERTVFASCSADQTVKIWDTRTKKRSAVGIRASQSDVNVITWNKKAGYLLASGHDDGTFSVWDLRTFKSGGQPSPVASFKWHNAPVTSIEWHPTEESVLAVSGADDQLSLWDLSVEPDTEEEGRLTSDGVEVPPQLLFVHQGQNDIKELHWHKQIPGCVLSTSNSGFNIFKTISV
ncbi:WD40-repeat-containing domain protein [Halteromyces radiatus]|uniref:WD40-repeat-containing domain protein n=1 Tax=Halteromyces radiatus TaxID=101107 RepID=UPI00221EE9A7|nr:WD40-repeat-containing domain protein [Halteromyces radiatus]KAI8092521.1 WD40-repeat-containing domain protein [Halteromyces radiatus]